MKLKQTLLISTVVLVLLITIPFIRLVNAQNNMATYTSLPYGYQLKYPVRMNVDDSLVAVRTRFFDGNTQIDVYYDNFTGTVSNAEAYIGYGNRFIDNNIDHHVTVNETKKIAGSNVHLLKWHREPLKHVENDKPYYASAEIVKNENEVYTIIMKSTQPISDDMDIVKSFRITKQQGTHKFGKVTSMKPLKVNEETKKVYHDLFMSDGLKWGIFEPSAPDGMDRLHSLERQLDYRFDLLIRYQSLDTDLPLKALQKAQDDRRFVELTLQTLHYEKDNSGIMYDILKGKYDHYFIKYAQDIRAFGHPILFRLNNEMNGDWVPYSSYHNSKDPDIYIEMWKYLYNVFKKNGVDNVLWVWNPNNLSMPGFQWNHSLLYYPGDDYVDVVGLTAYNTGTFYEGEVWSTFDELYSSLYDQYTEWFDQPLMISEFASSSIGGDKALWVKSMFEELHKYPKIKAAIWWSHTDFDPSNQPARIYKLDETPELADVFKRYLSEYP